jgi:uncharacterized protein (DUF2336 family)
MAAQPRNMNMEFRGYNTAELLALERLAREPSSDKRRELMCRLADILVEQSDVNSGETVQLLGQTLVGLLDKVEESGRIELSTRVAAHALTPHRLALGLATDPSSRVAEPVLLHSPALTDDDMVEIAREHSVGHLLAMSRRARISAMLTDALIRRRSMPVSAAVASNPGAEISETGFSSLADDAPSSNGLAEALSRRTDIPESVAEKVIASLSPEHRLRLKAIWSGHNSRTDELFAEAAREMSEVRLARKRGLLEAKAATRAISAGIRSLDQVITQFAGSNRLSETAHVIAAMARLPEDAVRAALNRRNSTIIAVVCRSLNLGDTAFEEVTRMRCSMLGLPASDGNQLLQAFRALDIESARRTVRFASAKMAATRSGEERRTWQNAHPAEPSDGTGDRRRLADRRLAGRRALG